jgi:hypothetical protein
MIDANDPSVVSNLAAMKNYYGEEALNAMTPAEFYNTFKKFTAEKGNIGA